MRTFVLVSACVVALAAAGIAVGRSFDGNSKSAKSVSGTFTATTASKVDTRTCTTSDGKTLVSSTGTYTGTASGDPDLTGPATLSAHALINSTDNVGTVSGTLKIDVSSGADTTAHYNAVYSGGSLAGLASGHAQDPHAKLLANVSAGFTAAGGFTDGKIGGTTGGGAVELGPGQCKSSQSVKENSEANGTVSAISSTSITVAGLTCSVPASLQSTLSALSLAVGSRAEIRCSLSGGAATLVKVEGSKHH
ncbi:MAG TPA: hypothetical protein VKP14_08360 [Gaiellaceae bacterium]|nr:hypothetical protein [Gaiellaceae bacterium]